jgi:hypothetical protein
MVFVLGGIFGIFVFGEAYPHILAIYTAGSYGDLLVSQSLGISQGQFALLLIAVAVGAFVATTWIEKRVNPSADSFRFPVRLHRMAAAGVLVLGLVLAALPDRKDSLMAKAADPGYQRAHPVERISPDEMAFQIMDRDPRMIPVDVRDAAEFARSSLPGAVNMQTAAMLGKEYRDVLSREQTRKVFFARDEATAVRAATLAGLLGFSNVAVLQDGLDGFESTILKPGSQPAPDEVTARFRARAGTEIATLIAQRGAAKPVRRIKKVQGGCGS